MRLRLQFDAPVRDVRFVERRAAQDAQGKRLGRKVSGPAVGNLFGFGKIR